MSEPSAKVLIIGGPGGRQGDFLNTISQVKIKSSAPARSGEGVIPMHFGRVQVGPDLDMQLFGADRDRVGEVIEAISPGIVGGIVLVDSTDTNDPHFTSEALDLMSQHGVPAVVVRTDPDVPSEGIERVLSLPAGSVGDCIGMEKEAVKQAVVSVLEAAVAMAEGSAA